MTKIYVLISQTGRSKKVKMMSLDFNQIKNAKVSLKTKHYIVAHKLDKIVDIFGEDETLLNGKTIEILGDGNKVKMEILSIQVITDDDIKISIKFNGKKYNVRSTIDTSKIESDNASQADWIISNSNPYVRYACKEIHYQFMDMAQEVEDLIDDHKELSTLGDDERNEIEKMVIKYVDSAV